MSDVLHAINQRMHPGTTCPTQCVKPIGECPIISRVKDWDGMPCYEAVLALWPGGSEALTTAEVVGWFASVNCRVLRIAQVMHESGIGISITDGIDHSSGFEGCRTWEVMFVDKADLAGRRATDAQFDKEQRLWDSVYSWEAMPYLVDRACASAVDIDSRMIAADRVLAMLNQTDDSEHRERLMSTAGDKLGLTREQMLRRKHTLANRRARDVNLDEELYIWEQRAVQA
ncbi:MAG: hypothetical protein RLZZ524_1629 [Pseudomonadota bacterium]|jgi:hypothetical protein